MTHNANADESKNTVKISGTINAVIYHNPENSFIVFKLKHNNKNTLLHRTDIVVQGVCPDITILDNIEKAVGLTCEVEGKKIRHPKYGEQIEADRIVLHIQGLYFFLTSIVSGLGEKLARSLLNHYGEQQLIQILENNPQELLKFKGIKEKKLNKIMQSWNKYRAIRNLAEFFGKHGISVTSNLLLKIYKFFKESNKEMSMVQIIQENPYILTDIRGIGFKTADRLAIGLGIDPYSAFRINALVNYILTSEASTNGHTYLYMDMLIDLMNREIGSADTDKLLTALNHVLDDDRYCVEQNRVGLRLYRKMEEGIESNLKERLSWQNNYRISEDEFLRYISKKEQEMGIKLGSEQVQALREIMTQGHNVFIVCGYAGTGKSTISKIILDFYNDYFMHKRNSVHDDESGIITCAFTGMASKRINEVTGYPSKTIHSLLKFSSEGFTYNITNPLPYNVVLIDESSMINLPLFHALMKAIKKDAVIIMVGDDAQLPPIGEGNVFSDLLSKSWIPKVKLTQIYRQDSNSVLTYFADYIRKGQMPVELSVPKDREYRDFYIAYRDIPNYWKLKDEIPESELQIKRDELNREIRAQLIELIGKSIKEYDLQGIHKITDIQVITAKKDGILGTRELNVILQNYLNDLYQQQANIKGFTIKQYDKVIHLKNQNMPVMSRTAYNIHAASGSLDLEKISRHATIRRVYNGNLGIILDIDEDSEMFAVEYPDSNKDNIVVFYSFDDFADIVFLGYALTVHKVQGNQFPYVFMPVVNSFAIMLHNKLLYTAITRARKKIFIIGQHYAFKKASTSIVKTTRLTWLSLASNPDN